MIYDCFSLFNELDLLEIRLNILNEVVDKFVIVEANRTHSNKEKPFYFAENKLRFDKFLDKITYIQIDEYPCFESSWVYENHQRNEIMRGLINCAPDDIILLSDLDEIPNPEVILKINPNTICALEQQMHCCYLNARTVTTSKWYGTRIMRFSNVEADEISKYSYTFSDHLIESINVGPTFSKIRMLDGLPKIKNGGWHFTYLGGIESIAKKIQSFAHQEFNKPEYTDLNIIKKKINKGIDLFNPLENRFAPVPCTIKYLPRYIVDNIENYKHLVQAVPFGNGLRRLCLSVWYFIFVHFVFYPYKKVKRILRKFVYKG
jgi:beta-1,4-mannosyl-glycoprotein beta-1,4-N-acetylglucosaminyltransferase